MKPHDDQPPSDEKSLYSHARKDERTGRVPQPAARDATACLLHRIQYRKQGCADVLSEIVCKQRMDSTGVCRVDRRQFGENSVCPCDHSCNRCHSAENVGQYTSHHVRYLSRLVITLYTRSPSLGIDSCLCYRASFLRKRLPAQNGV